MCINLLFPDAIKLKGKYHGDSASFQTLHGQKPITDITQVCYELPLQCNCGNACEVGPVVPIKLPKPWDIPSEICI